MTSENMLVWAFQNNFSAKIGPGDCQFVTDNVALALDLPTFLLEPYQLPLGK